MGSDYDIEFRRVFVEHWPTLHTYLTRLTGDPDASSDTAQEAFVRLYQRGRLPGDARAWLVSVAHNLLRDGGRTRRRRERLLESTPIEAWRGSPPAQPDEATARNEERSSVREMLDRLPERQRRILLLRASGMKYREIAAALRITTDSVGTTLARALDAFRTRHTGFGGEHAPE